MQYKWKSGISTHGVDANVAAMHIEKILSRGDDILEDAKSPRSPIHLLFEWEDTEAAHQWRLHQSRMIQNHLIAIELKGDNVVMSPAFFNVTIENKQQYVSRQTVLESPKLQDQILEQCLRDAKSFQNKYKHLSQFFTFFDQLETFIENVSYKMASQSDATL